MLRLLQVLAPPVLLMNIVGCGVWPGEPSPGWELRPGTIEFYQQDVVIELPDTVQTGVPFEITVGTWGGGCTAQGPTGTSLNSMELIVEPMDSVATGKNLVCTDDLRLYQHHVSYTLQQPGAWVAHIVGLSEPGLAPFTVDRSVVVQ